MRRVSDDDLYSTKNTGRKDDAIKAKWHLLPKMAQESIVAVLTFGAEKYGDDNWRLVPEKRTRYFSAAMRHMWAWFMGEERDQESGLPHLAHAATCLMFLMEDDFESNN